MGNESDDKVDYANGRAPAKSPINLPQNYFSTDFFFSEERRQWLEFDSTGMPSSLSAFELKLP